MNQEDYKAYFTNLSEVRRINALMDYYQATEELIVKHKSIFMALDLPPEVTDNLRRLHGYSDNA